MFCALILLVIKIPVTGCWHVNTNKRSDLPHTLSLTFQGCLCTSPGCLRQDTPSLTLVQQLQLQCYLLQLNLKQCLLQVHRGVYVAAEILYQRFLPMVEEQLASSPSAKIAFTVCKLCKLCDVLQCCFQGTMHT